MTKAFPILQPISTEKSSRAQEIQRYTFLVQRTANKTEIKRAINELYGVEVAEIKTMTLPKKVRMVGKNREFLKRPVFKRAIISLKDGKTIDPNKLKDSKKSK